MIMLTKIIAQYTQTPEATIARLLKMPTDAIYEDAAYKQLVDSLDRDYLHQTLQQARNAYEVGLPDFKERMRVYFDFTDSPMSPFTLANWLVGFLNYPDKLADLPNLHGRVPHNAIQNGLPELFKVLEQMGEGRDAWQRALAVLAIPLVTNG